MQTLNPLQYHQAVSDWLQKNEAGVWDWFAAQKLQNSQNEEVRDQLLKETYRLSRESHSGAYKCCDAAMQRLGIEAPLTLYQANDGAMNAALFFIPGEVHIVLYGAILDKLSEIELTALFGHEIAHYLLWTMDDRSHRIAQQIIDDSVGQASNNYALYETARLLHLSTEVFADRGAVLAAGGSEPAIAVLLKVMTGLSATDPKAFLDQANELEAKGEISASVSHPEVFLRALFIDKWNGETPQLDNWVAQKLKGPMAIGALDILDQQELEELTAEFFNLFLHDTPLASDMVTTQVKQFFPDWTGAGRHIDLSKIKSDTLDRSLRDYFIALIVDLAHADPDQTDEMLVRGAAFSSSVGWNDEFRDNLKSLLKLRKQQIDRIFRESAKLDLGLVA